MTAPVLRAWHIELPFTAPLSLNDRLSWGMRARQVKEWRTAAYVLAKHHKIPAMRRIAVTLTYVPRDNRHRDGHNLHAAVKPLVDGIVDACVVPDDTDDYVIVNSPTITEKGSAGAHGGRLFLGIYELSFPAGEVPKAAVA